MPTGSQLAQVARDAAPTDRGVPSLLSTFAELSSASRALGAADTSNVSHSVLRALLVLAAFPLDGTYRALADVARELETNASTTHRYVSTWLAVGLLEQDSEVAQVSPPRLAAHSHVKEPYRCPPQPIP